MNMERTKIPTPAGIENENKVWVTVSHTVNLGNYENIKFEAGYSQTLLPSENAPDKIDDMCVAIFDRLVEQGKAAYKELGRYKEK